MSKGHTKPTGCEHRCGSVLHSLCSSLLSAATVHASGMCLRAMFGNYTACIAVLCRASMSLCPSRAKLGGKHPSGVPRRISVLTFFRPVGCGPYGLAMTASHGNGRDIETVLRCVAVITFHHGISWQI